MDVAKVFASYGVGMYEVEHKAPADLDVVRMRLERMGATHQRSFHQQDRYFQHPSRDFAETDEALRIRQSRTDGTGETSTVLTYKGPKLDDETKTRREHETAIEDVDTAAAILEALGFVPVKTVEKDRERWSLGTVTVCLDAIEGLGTYVEVEITTDEDGLDESRRRATAVLDDLGIDSATTLTDSYLEMLLDHDA